MSGPRRAVPLKIDLAMRGLRVDDSAHEVVAGPNPLPPTLDLILPDDLRVSTPVQTAGEAAFVLVADRGQLFLEERGSANGRVAVKSGRPPRFYDRRTTRAVPMRRVATMLSSHLLVHPGEVCGFGIQGSPCRFCLEGARATGEGDAQASVADVLEVVRAAFDEGAAPFVFINSSAFAVDDGGFAAVAPYVETVRKHFDTLVAVQIHPPRSMQWIEQLYAIGVDAVSFNLEIFDPEMLDRHCIGRSRYIGRERYLEALAHASKIFPRGAVWSDLVLGLEPAASVRDGIDAFTELGVVPVLTPRRAATGTPSALAADEVAPLLAHLSRRVRERHIRTGWLREVALGVTPSEALRLAGEEPALAGAMRSITRTRLGHLAARGLARFRRRLRVRPVGDSGGDHGL